MSEPLPQVLVQIVYEYCTDEAALLDDFETRCARLQTDRSAASASQAALTSGRSKINELKMTGQFVNSIPSALSVSAHALWKIACTHGCVEAAAYIRRHFCLLMPELLAHDRVCSYTQCYPYYDAFWVPRSLRLTRDAMHLNECSLKLPAWESCYHEVSLYSVQHLRFNVEGDIEVVTRSRTFTLCVGSLCASQFAFEIAARLSFL
jgi:hypothetical protein